MSHPETLAPAPTTGAGRPMPTDAHVAVARALVQGWHVDHARRIGGAVAIRQLTWWVESIGQPVTRSYGSGNGYAWARFPDDSVAVVDADGFLFHLAHYDDVRAAHRSA